MKEGFAQFVKYGLVGVVNTLLTFSTYWLFKAVGLNIDAANLLSYGAGMVCSFVLNKLWTFRAHGHGWGRELAVFVGGAGLCWLLQWGAFRAFITWWPEVVAQVAGMAVYTLLNFFFNKLITFKHKS